MRGDERQVTNFKRLYNENQFNDAHPNMQFRTQT